jgi:hypothetical protein
MLTILSSTMNRADRAFRSAICGLFMFGIVGIYVFTWAIILAELIQRIF